MSLFMSLFTRRGDGILDGHYARVIPGVVGFLGEVAFDCKGIDNVFNLLMNN